MSRVKNIAAMQIDPVIATWIITRLIGIVFLIVVRPTDGIMGLTWQWSTAMVQGENPYLIPGTAYPPLAMFSFAAIGLFATSGTFTGFFITSVLCLDALAFWYSRKTESVMNVTQWWQRPSVIWVAIPVVVGPLFWFWRYDLAPAILSMIALHYAMRGKWQHSYWLFGIGLALKPYLLILAPLWVCWEWVSEGRRPRILTLVHRGLALLLPSLLAAVCMTWFLGDTSWWQSYGFQASRAMTMDSFPATLIASLDHLGIGTQQVVNDPLCLCYTRVGDYAHALQGGLQILLVVGLLATYWRLFKAGNNPQAFAYATVICMTLLIGLHPVFSPQYLIWMVVYLPLLQGVLLRQVLFYAGAATLFTHTSYPYLYSHITAFDTVGMALTWGKAICFAALVWYAWKAITPVTALPSTESASAAPTSPV
jgi:hypothetical protein